MDGSSTRSLVSVSLAALLALLAVPGSSSAATLLDNDELKLDAGAVARAVSGARFFGDSTSTDYGTFVQNARLKLGAEYKDYTKLVVQYEAGGGNARALDVFGELTAFDPIFVRIGRYKMSVSQEALIGGGNLPFISRTLLNRFVPVRRIGTEVYGVFDVGTLTIRPEVGLFQPSVGTFDEPAGQLVMGRILVSTDMGLEFHAGYTGHVFDSNELAADAPNNPTDESRRVFRYDDPFDFAVTYKKDRVDLHLEGVAVLDSPTDETALGGYLHGGYRFGESDAVQPKPMLGYDIVEEESLTQRATAGLNLYWWDSPVYTIFNYRYQTTDRSAIPDQHELFVALSANL